MSTKIISVRTSKDSYKLLKKRAIDKGISVSELIDKISKHFLAIRQNDRIPHEDFIENDIIFRTKMEEGLYKSLSIYGIVNDYTLPYLMSVIVSSYVRLEDPIINIE